MFENILEGLVKIQNLIRLTFNRSEKRIYKDSTHQEAKKGMLKILVMNLFVNCKRYESES